LIIRGSSALPPLTPIRAAAAEPHQVVPVEDLNGEAGPRAEDGGDVRDPGRGQVRGR
jgi:hypothetical protein